MTMNEFTSARASVVPDTDDERSSVPTEFGLAGRDGPLLCAPGTGRCVCPPADAPADAERCMWIFDAAGLSGILIGVGVGLRIMGMWGCERGLRGEGGASAMVPTTFASK